jgi:hypothetical protein
VPTGQDAGAGLRYQGNVNLDRAAATTHRQMVSKKEREVSFNKCYAAGEIWIVVFKGPSGFL